MPVADLPTLETVRDTLRKASDRDFFIRLFPGLEARHALQDAIARDVPQIARYDMARDDHLHRVILLARMHVGSLPPETHEDRYTAIAETILAAAGGSLARPADPADLPEAARDRPAASVAGAGAGRAGGGVTEARGAFGAELHGPLFNGLPPADPGFLPTLLAPAPAPGSSPEALSRWVSGEIAEPGGLAIGVDGGLLEEALVEIESEMIADEAGFLARDGMPPRLAAPLSRDILDWLREERAAVGHPDAGACRGFAEAVEETLAAWCPGRPERLAGAGACLRIHEDLARSIGVAAALEDAFLGETGEDGPERLGQDHRGAIRPEARLARGVVFRRAAFLHFVAAVPAEEALGVALLELRCAQALRQAPEAEQDDLYRRFDALFLADCRRPLGAYMMAENDPCPEF